MRRTIAEQPREPDQVGNQVALEYLQERQLYDPMARSVADGWAPENRLTPSVVAITAQQGRRATGGKWTRPDIVLVAVRKFRFLPGPRLSVVTFEVKPGWALDVTAVYKALAHRRAATASVVLIHSEALDTDVLRTVCAEASKHGVGVVVADDPGNPDTWETLVDLAFADPDPDSADTFLATQLSPEHQDEVMRLLAE